MRPPALASAISMSLRVAQSKSASSRLRLASGSRMWASKPAEITIRSGRNSRNRGRMTVSKAAAGVGGTGRGVDDGVVRAALAHRAGAGIERHVMGRAVHHGAVGPEDALRAVAVVHVEVDDGGALDAVFFLGVTGGDGGVVEEAKSHRARALRVVAGGARGDEGVCGLAGHHFVDRVHGAARRA